MRLAEVLPARTVDLDSREQLDIGPRRAPLDQTVDFIRLARMLALARRDQIDLAPPRGERARTSQGSKQTQLCHAAEIEADAATIRAAVLPDLVPYDNRLVLESPAVHDHERFRQQRIRRPEIKMRRPQRQI